jgi:hypothetical protein
MSFKLTIEIKDDSSSQVDFDGTINHIVLLGVLESIKHGILSTADLMAAQESISSSTEIKEAAKSAAS